MTPHTIARSLSPAHLQDAICARRCARLFGDPACWDIGLPPEQGHDGLCGGQEAITCKAVAERYVRISVRAIIEEEGS